MSEQQPSPPTPGVVDLGHGVVMTTEQDALSSALAAAQGAVRSAEKNAKNPHLRNQYADLESVIQAAREAMTANGLALCAFPVARDGWAGVVYVLSHSSGQWRRGELLHAIKGSNALQPAQADGVCISYARRYVLMSVMQIAAGDDTDGAVEVRDSRPTGSRPRSSGRRPAPAPKAERPKPQARRRTTGDPAGKVDTRAAYWRGFQVDLKPLARPPAHSAYDVLKGWLASRGKPKPSEMTCAGLDTLWGWLLDEGLQRVGAWADTPEGRKVLEGPAGEVVGGGA